MLERERDPDFVPPEPVAFAGPSRGRGERRKGGSGKEKSSAPTPPIPALTTLPRRRRRTSVSTVEEDTPEGGHSKGPIWNFFSKWMTGKLVLKMVSFVRC